jgi:hypothetical protein
LNVSQGDNQCDTSQEEVLKIGMGNVSQHSQQTVLMGSVAKSQDNYRMPKTAINYHKMKKGLF